MLSVSAAFAEDSVADELAVDNEISSDSLTVDEDSQALSESKVVTNDTFYNYFDESGTILSNVSDEELTFKGDFENIGVDTITLNKTIKLTGDNTTLKNIAIDVKANNVIISGFTIYNDNNNKTCAAISVSNVTNVEIVNTEITFTAVEDTDGYAIYANAADNLKLLNNIILYTGSTTGNSINNGIYVNSNNAKIKGNKFGLSLVSCYVPWFEIPAGSGNWVSFPVSEGIVIDSSENVTFDENTVLVGYNNVSGSYDTIYAISFKNSDNADISNNNITAYGHTYIYGLQVSGANFTISDNNIISSSDIYYANGIDIEGPANGVVKNNNISACGVVSAYPIYSGMNGQNVSADYLNNNIYGEGYLVIGMSLGDVESLIKDNFIQVAGNYTTAIASKVKILIVDSNNIIEGSSQTGDQYVWESFGVDASAIKVISGDATITMNNITSVGKGVYVKNAKANINNNDIYVVTDANNEGYAIYANNIEDLIISGNEITYVGNTAGAIDNGVFVCNATGAIIQGNKFNLSLVSAYVKWVEEPAGSWNYVAYPVSEGIVISSSSNVSFRYNDVFVNYTSVLGSYDTIYAVNFKNSENAVISENNITASGHTYIYGIQISGDNFNISENRIISVSDVYYANGIDIEGPASGVVEDNLICAIGITSSYPIYSGMNGEDVNVTYANNYILGKGYLVIGMSLGDIESNIDNNLIYLSGNYTTGIAYAGDLLNASNNRIFLNSSDVGTESIWESFGVDTCGIKVVTGNALLNNNTIITYAKGVYLSGKEFILINNTIDVYAHDGIDAYAIYAKTLSNIAIVDNSIEYYGATTGNSINNAVYVSNVKGLTIIGRNDFNISLVSCYVPWAEIPAGSGNWVSSPVSEGIVIDSSKNVIFAENNVNVDYINISGSYDTIYAISFKDSNNSIISANNITAKGHTYIYGIQMSGDNFAIRKNNITSISDVYYANGIDIEGPASGVVEENNINVKGVISAYPIYSGMNGQPVSVNYTNNEIVGDAYLVIGMSLGDVESNIVKNKISLTGNYTTGIAFAGSKMTVDGNTIFADGSNVGNLTIWESFGVDTCGIKVIGAEADILDNIIRTTGEYTIISKDSNSNIMNNYLFANSTTGSKSMKITPSFKTIISAVDLYTTYLSGDVYFVTLKDEDCNPIVNATAILSGNSKMLFANTNNEGVAMFFVDDWDVGDYIVDISYLGNDTYSAQSIKGYISIGLRPSEIVGPTSVNVLITTIKDGYVYTFTLMDDFDCCLSNETVTISFNGKTEKVTTDALGVVNYKLVANKVGNQKLTIKFDSNKNYVESTLTATVKITKEASKLTASKKTYKVKAKSKKYTATLKDSKGKGIKGAKVFLKVNGKKYKATTNSKGKATFNLKKLTKKGKYTAKVSYAGSNLYKATSVKVKITVKK